MLVRFLLALIIFLPLPVMAGIYKWADENGKIHFSDKPPAQKKNLTQVEKLPAAQRQNLTKSAVESPVLQLSEAEQLATKNELLARSQTLQIRAMLYRQDYARLTQRLKLLAQQRSQDMSLERDEVNAYSSFSVTTKQMKDHLNRWVAQHPASFQPYIARAQYYYARAFEARGEDWGSETSQSQRDSMVIMLEKAKNDIAIAFNRHADVPYAWRIAYATHLLLGNTVTAKQLIQKGIDRFPLSYTLHRVRLHFNKPRWFGSYEKMTMLLRELSPEMRTHPYLNCLKTTLITDMAQVARTARRFNRALDILDSGISRPELQSCADLYYATGLTLSRKKEYEDAIRYLNHAIQLNGENADYYHRLGSAYFHLGQHEKAADAILLAAVLEPTNEDIQKRRDSIAQHLAFEAANDKDSSKRQHNLRLIDLARDLAPDHYNVYYHRATYYFNLGDYGRSEQELRKAIELKPDEFKLYQRIDYVIIRKNKDWNAITQLWQQYLELRPNDSEALLEIGGAYFHWRKFKEARHYLSQSAELGNMAAKNFLTQLPAN